MIFCALTATDGLFLASRQKLDKLNGRCSTARRSWLAPRQHARARLEYVLKQRGVSADTVKSIVTNIGIPARDGAFIAGGYDFAIFNEPNMSKMEKAGQAHMVTSIGKEVGRADYTVFFAKKSWVEKNPDLAQKWTNAIARGQAFMKTASDKDIAEAIAPSSRPHDRRQHRGRAPLSQHRRADLGRVPW